MRHALLRCLLAGKVRKPLGEKRRYVHIAGGGGGKHLRIPRPPQTLVPLRAVGWNIHKVPPLPPKYVLPQPVYIGVGAFKAARLFKIAAQHAGGKILRLCLYALHLNIAEAVKGKLRRQHRRTAVRYICIRRPRGAQIGSVYLSVLPQHLAVLKRYAPPLGRAAGKAHKAGKILPEIQHLLA